MFKSFKYRIYPTVEQATKIDQSISVCRLVYNLALEVKISAWQSARKNMSYFALCRQLVELRAAYPWVKAIDSQALQAAVKRLDVSYARFFKGSGFPKFKSKKGGQSFLCPNHPKRIDWEKGTLTIPKNKNIPIRLSRKFEGLIKTITISKTPSGKYFASILVETPDQPPAKPVIESRRTIGIDLGIKSFVVTSDGVSFENNRFLKNSLGRLKCLQRRAARKKNGSKNRKKVIKKLSIIHERISNQRADHIHKTTTRLIHDNQVNTFVLESLNVTGMMQNHKLAQAISDVSFGEFARQMQYKCVWFGKNLIAIGQFVPSSKRCFSCGAINEALTLADREWTCSCGAHHDRDLNAAKNIKYYGLLKHSGEGIAGEPVESPALAGAMKQEDSGKELMPSLQGA